MNKSTVSGVIIGLLTFGCLSNNSAGLALNSHDNTTATRINTSDIEYLKKLPVHMPYESPGHNDENVVGASIIRSPEAKKVFFEFINIIPLDHTTLYDFYSQRIKKDIESRQNIKSAEEYRKYWKQIEVESDPPPFKRIVEILDFVEISATAFFVKAREFGDTYPVKIDEYVQISENRYSFIKETDGWKYDGRTE